MKSIHCAYFTPPSSTSDNCACSAYAYIGARGLSQAITRPVVRVDVTRTRRRDLHRCTSECMHAQEIPPECELAKKRTERIAAPYIIDSTYISSMLGSNSGSQQPFIQAKHFETVFTAIASQVSSSFVDWDSGCNQCILHVIPYNTTVLLAYKFSYTLSLLFFQCTAPRSLHQWYSFNSCGQLLYRLRGAAGLWHHGAWRFVLLLRVQATQQYRTCIVHTGCTVQRLLHARTYSLYRNVYMHIIMVLSI